MNRHIFLTNAPRKKWIGDGFCSIRASDFRIKQRGMSQFDKVRKSLEDLGMELGADIELTDIETIHDPQTAYQITFKANYYTFK